MVVSKTRGTGEACDVPTGLAAAITEYADPALDTRLIAMVQARASGANVHAAAGLLQAYVCWAAVRRQARRKGNLLRFLEADRELCNAKSALRLFLRRTALGESTPAVA